ncbi:LysR family transcriptional regulator [Gemmobacter sp.]|uniref:LysR family transcriptional regulator n=1 Tax=Gemmobacter sp. TaxID=1898957 RepID=UPI002AFFAB78|nr:LysR family transcriptional regulator [Gemmobacter sp.]
MVDFRGLETLVWVVALGSFRKAADKLGTTQPAISHRISQLEDQVGARLLNRDMKVVMPTSEGREMLRYAEQLLALRTEMLVRVRDRTAIRGVVRLGVAETIVHTWLTDLIQQLDRTYPKLSIEIEVDVSVNLQTKLLAQEVDIAFLQGPVSGPRISNKLLCEYPICFLANPEIDLPTPATLSDIAQYSLITFSRRTQPYEIIRALFNQAGAARVKIHASASMATAIRLAVAGIGIAVIPFDLVLTEIRERKLRVVQTDAQLPPLSFYASWISTPENYEVGLVANVAARTAATWPADMNVMARDD